MKKNVNYKQKAKSQLGVDAGTAFGRLKKILLYAYAVKCNDNICARCEQPINSIEEFSVEHIIPWLHAANAQELFYDLENIAFSHLSCNVKNARPLHKKYFTQEEVTAANRKAWREYGQRKRSKKS